MRKKFELFVLIILLIILVGALAYSQYGERLSKQNSSFVAMIEYANAEQGIKFNYPSFFKTTLIGDEAKKAGTFFRATRDQTSLLSIRRETGLGVLKMTGGTVLDTLQKNLDRQYPKQYPDFKKQLLEDVIVGAEKGFKIEFTYTGNDKITTMREQLVVIVVRDSDGYFFSFQSPATDYPSKVSDFDEILKTIILTDPIKIGFSHTDPISSHVGTDSWEVDQEGVIKSYKNNSCG